MSTRVADEQERRMREILGDDLYEALGNGEKIKVLTPEEAERRTKS